MPTEATSKNWYSSYNKMPNLWSNSKRLISKFGAWKKVREIVPKGVHHRTKFEPKEESHCTESLRNLTAQHSILIKGSAKIRCNHKALKLIHHSDATWPQCHPVSRELPYLALIYWHYILNTNYMMESIFKLMRTDLLEPKDTQTRNHNVSRNYWNSCTRRIGGSVLPSTNKV